MESATTKYQKLIEMMEAFVSGQGRSRDFVRQMEGEFATSDLDDDERFSDLRMALAMFGASDPEYDEKMLAGECKARAVHRAATSVLEEYGENGYLEKWVEHPFPIRHLELLSEQLALPQNAG